MIMVLGLLVIVAAAAVLLGGGGMTLFREPSRSPRSGLGPPIVMALGGGVVIVVLLLVAMLGIGGLRSGRAAPEAAEPAVSTSVSEEIGDDPPASVAGPRSTFDGVARLDANGSDLRPPPSIGDLAGGDLLDVEVAGFVGGTQGVIAQCPDLRATNCTNVYPVRADEGGQVRVPYRVVEGADAETLVVEIDSERVGAALAFGERAPGLARLSADRGVVRITGGSPSARVRIARCDSDATAVSQCTAGPSMVLADDGSGRAQIMGGRKAQRIVLVDHRGVVVADPVALPGLPGPIVDHDPARLLIGFGLALALLSVVIVLIRSTDWRAPAEAATPFLDAAALDA